MKGKHFYIIIFPRSQPMTLLLVSKLLTTHQLLIRSFVPASVYEIQLQVFGRPEGKDEYTAPMNHVMALIRTMVLLRNRFTTKPPPVMSYAIFLKLLNMSGLLYKKDNTVSMRI